MAAKKDQKKIIVDLLHSTGREGIDDLVRWLEKTDFFTAPASSSPSKHGCKEGGLVEHCLNVYTAFESKRKLYDLGIKDDESIIASVCHDFCKIDLYKPNVMKGGKISEAKPYVRDDRFPFGHGEKSVVLASKHIDLTDNEQLMIRWHMGTYDEEFEKNRNYFEPVCPAIYAFHFADHEATLYLDDRKIKNKK
jgi:hypothetical protein